MRFRVRVTGLREAQTTLRTMGRAAPVALGEALYREGETIMARSKAEFVPVATGTLRASGHVTLPQRIGQRMRVVLGFGGPAAPYALAVHENPRSGQTGGVSPRGRLYKLWARVGEWKYLETPAKAATAGMADRLAGALRAILVRGARRAPR